MRFTINYNHNYWANGSGWSHSETMDTWTEDVEASDINEALEVLERNILKDIDFEDGEGIADWEEEDFVKAAEAEEGDTQIEIEAIPFDVDDDDDEDASYYIIYTAWLSDMVKESWKYKKIVEDKQVG